MKPAAVADDPKSKQREAHAAFKAHAAKQKLQKLKAAAEAHKATRLASLQKEQLSSLESEPDPESEPEPEVQPEIVPTFPLIVTLSGLTATGGDHKRVAVYTFCVTSVRSNGGMELHSFSERFSSALEKHQLMLELELPAFAQIDADAVFPGRQLLWRTSQDIQMSMERGEQLAKYYSALLRAAAPEAEAEAREALREMYGIVWPEVAPSPRAAEYASACAETTRAALAREDLGAILYIKMMDFPLKLFEILHLK